MAIKIYRSTDAGAPSLTGQAGSMITVLDAVLVNGYNTVSVSGITRVGATATVVCAAAHGLSTGDSALIAGAAQGDYNIDAVITVVDPTTFTYTVANSPATPATGTITVKRAPAGFTKTFAGTNKGVYRSNDLTGNRLYLRCDDTGGSSGGGGEARMYGYEVMTSVDAGTNPFPTAAQSSNGYLWRKSSTTDATARAWMFITDGKMLYYFNQYNLIAAEAMTSPTFSGAFGDFLSYKAGDAYSTVITGCSAAGSTSSAPNGLFRSFQSVTSSSNFSSSVVVARDYTGVPGARYIGLLGAGFGSTFGNSAYISYPHLTDSGYYLSPVVLTQASPSLVRGRMPGMFEGWHARTFNHGDLIDNVQGLPGRTLMHIYGQDGSTAGCILLDITGPWDA